MKIIFVLNSIIKIVLLNIFNNDKISFLCYIDRRCKISKNVRIKRFSVLHNVKIDEYSYIEANCTIINSDIGKYCSISSEVKIGLPAHPITYVSTSPVWYTEDSYEKYCERCIVKNDVWIGNDAKIKAGLTLGNGSIIGTSAVVTKNVDDYAIVVGIPAKTIKYRFNKNLILKLLEIKWWEKNKKVLDIYKDIFDSPEIFIKEIESVIKKDNT